MQVGPLAFADGTAYHWKQSAFHQGHPPQLVSVEGTQHYQRPQPAGTQTLPPGTGA